MCPYILYNICEHFLRAHLLYCENSEKNQDIVSIGKNTAAKYQVLDNLLPDLIKAGFTEILTIDLDTQEINYLHEDKSKTRKVYRHFLCTHLPHSEMIALMAISNCELGGVTGDQTFGEAFSAGKIIVYETLVHKIDFINKFINRLYSETSSKEVMSLIELLASANLVETNSTKNRLQFTQLKKLLHDREVIEKYKSACRTLAKSNDLATHINLLIPEIAFGNDKKIDSAAELIKNLKSDFSTKFSQYISLLENIIVEKSRCKNTVILQASILAILLMILSSLKKDDKEYLRWTDALSELFPGLVFESVYLKQFCMNCFKHLAETYPVLLRHPLTVKELSSFDPKFKLNLNRLKLGHDEKLDALILNDYKTYCEKDRFDEFHLQGEDVQKRIKFFYLLIQFSHDYPNPTRSCYALCGWFILFKKYLLNGIKFSDNHRLVQSIEAHLKILQFNSRFEKFYLNQLGIFSKENPAMLKNPLFIEDYGKTSISLSSLKINIYENLNHHPQYVKALLSAFKDNYQLKLAGFTNKDPSKKPHLDLIHSVFIAASDHKDQGQAYHALIGGLFLVKKSIRKEWLFLHQSTLLMIVEELLKLSGINVDSDDKYYLQALMDFSDQYPSILSNPLISLDSQGSIRQQWSFH